MYFIAYKGLVEWKARNRHLYATRQEAEAKLAELIRESAPEYANRYRVMDAEHDPGRSILEARHGFA